MSTFVVRDFVTVNDVFESYNHYKQLGENFVVIEPVSNQKQAPDAKVAYYKTSFKFVNGRIIPFYLKFSPFVCGGVKPLAVRKDVGPQITFRTTTKTENGENIGECVKIIIDAWKEAVENHLVLGPLTKETTLGISKKIPAQRKIIECIQYGYIKDRTYIEIEEPIVRIVFRAVSTIDKTLKANISIVRDTKLESTPSVAEDNALKFTTLNIEHDCVQRSKITGVFNFASTINSSQGISNSAEVYKIIIKKPDVSADFDSLLDDTTREMMGLNVKNEQPQSSSSDHHSNRDDASSSHTADNQGLTAEELMNMAGQ